MTNFTISKLYPKCVLKDGISFAECLTEENAKVVCASLNLTDVTPGVIAKRLLWAVEAEKVLEWIEKIAAANYEQDPDLRHNGARTLKRIVLKVRELLANMGAEMVGEQK